ncbi:stAR-related lipid transfer 9-like protein [Labeo rohita]|uniref:StAR-related lipid transfer 9-like protein n=1 Tax=Labeo rohita TaxID=84645 RepID=A0A498LPU2_LABRO|nr:stAR-related lipid transfer 9-like protein [Labeo rohita]
MANVKVAIRVRPLNSRESLDGGRLAVQVEDKVVRVRNVKLEGRLDGRSEGLPDSREKFMEFGFDFCYWSVDPAAPNYASQEEVFQDLGVCVLSGASEGYNVCLFAYGQTGSGKTYTMMGTPDSIGLTPRICQGLFRSGVESADGQSCRVEISFLEIYNERVRDLLRGAEQKKPAPLRVREHPEKGPYVQGLSQHVVTDYKQAVDLLEEGIANRITAATHVHDASSRSHAIFTIQYTQLDLKYLSLCCGSERADPQYCRDRITEGANINKSLVTLGIVISALAQNSQMFSSSQSINSVLSEGEGSTVGSQSSSLSGSGRRQCFIPYRDSVLTWLLKDSLGGNSKTIMIATVSPSSSSYNETLSTLRYAAHARNIVNKPRVNEDASVRLIRELREEIDRLKSMLLSFEMQRNPSPSLSDEREGSLSDIVLQNELKVEQLTKDWSDSWHDKRALLERYSVDINQNRAGVLIQSLLPHLIALEPDVLSTGVTIYHLREGVTRIGPQDDNLEEPHIVLPEGSSCEIENKCGVVTLKPVSGNICMVNEREIKEPCRLAQGAVITLGGLHKFRFNHPAEAAVLRERRRTSDGGLVYNSTEPNSPSSDIRVLGAGCHENENGTAPRQRLEEQQWYIECLREEIQMEQKRAERDLEREQARLRQQHTESDRKRVVQEELLKHHALRRAENRVRRKRLHYQLEKIARKRHLLEAKRELQRLENELLQGGDEASSADLGYPLKSRARPMTLRRHSFSADLLSRLYPQHTPIFSGPNKQTLTALKCDSYNGASEELRHSSGHVDEIVLVYSSEYESQERPRPSSAVQQQEDDVMSLVPSECNTDVLVSINPLAETSMLKEHHWMPDDLPMHNKFTNWSGINQQPPSTLSKIHRPTGQHFTKLSPSCWQEPPEKTDRRAQEIEKLRKERERVLASVHMDMSPHQLTVELTEAKLHYGQGETDTLLNILKTGTKEASSAWNKQELLNRHRKSIESLRKEREARLQMCRRARSLSPGKHPIPVNYEEPSQRVSDLPSRRREYLQQLRQEIVETSRVPDPPRREGQCPSDIEILLRDYSRAREEARAEIARARDRLRERTEQEKRRLQQQALSQAVKDDLRFRTRVSNSTLCSGSNLSLSSGPTSGYNSSNTALLKDITSPLIQVNGVSEFKIRTRPPVIPLQTSKAQRRWLSVQDVSLETSVTGYEPESSSTPSSPPFARQRTLSFGSPSSISTSYQDIADCTLASAISEVYLASGGDVRNLLAGKAAAGWRHQGVEKGVQVFHKATSRPSAHGFLGAVELERPLASLWSIVRDHSKTHLYHESIKSAWTRPLDQSTQLVYLLTDVSNCQLKQPRDFCCLSTESKQDDMWVLAMQSVFEETLPRPSMDTIRGEILPSAWILQPSQRNGREVVTVVYLLQVDLGSPSLAPRLLNTVSRKQAAVIADLDSFFSL